MFTRQDDQSSMNSLAARQEIILEKLNELKNQLVTMKNNSRMCNKPAQFPKGGKNSKSTSAVAGPPQGRCKPKVSEISDGL